jgi:hypothetical protein
MNDVVLEPAIGTVDGVNAAFRTSVAYHTGTLRAYIDGQLVGTINEDLNGPAELGGRDVQMGVPPRTDTILYFWYLTGPPTSGACPCPPRSMRSILLQPNLLSGTDLVPRMQSAEVV